MAIGNWHNGSILYFIHRRARGPSCTRGLQQETAYLDTEVVVWDDDGDGKCDEVSVVA